MGRNSTGIVLNTSTLNINIDELRRSKVFINGKNTNATISWDSGSSLKIYTYYDKDYIELSYMVDDEKFRYKVYIEKVKSNLGIGFNHYFICPNTNRLCKILYLTYAENKFYSRRAYQNKIYYKTQKSSNLSYYNDRYWQIEGRIERLKEKKIVSFYNGIKTKRMLLLERLNKEQAILDEQRFTLGMPIALKRIGFVV